MSAKQYFDNHSHHFAYHKDPEVYTPIINYLKKTEHSDARKILDFGCGDGLFLKCLIDNKIKGDFFGSDISQGMINLAREKTQERNVDLFLADGFKMPINPNAKFDVIHVDMILHHLIGETRSESIKLVHKMLTILMGMLSERGILIIEEHLSTSYLIPSFGSFVAFYGLKLLNFLKIDMSRFVNEIQLGLEVNFFYEEQLRKILFKHGTPERIRRETSTPTKFRKLFLVKEIGVMTFVVRRSNND